MELISLSVIKWITPHQWSGVWYVFCKQLLCIHTAMTQVQPKKASLHTALSKKTALNQQHKHCSWHNLKVKMISLLFLFLFCVPLRPRSVLFIPSSCFILLFLTVLYPTSLLTMCHALSSCCIIVAPDTINNHVKTCHEEQKNLHFFAPEYGGRHPRNDTLCYLSCYG